MVPVDYKRLYLLLNEIKTTCEQMDIRWCITWGTLLGAIRHKDFIPSPDQDVDIFLIDVDNDIYKKFIRHFDDHQEYRSHCGNSNPAYIYDTTAESGSEICRVGNKNGGIEGYYYFRNTPIRKDDLENLTTLMIGKIECPVPNRPEMLLEELYKDWMIPSKEHIHYGNFEQKMIRRAEKGI